MKKRFISLLLCAVMVLFCFAGCAEKDNRQAIMEIGKKSSADAATISMYLMSEEPVSPEQEKLIEDAVNEIIEDKFTVHVDLRYFTPETYYAELDGDLLATEEYYANLSKSGTSRGTGEGETENMDKYITEDGLPNVYYPPIKDFQVDIFYFSGYDKYYQYDDKGYLYTIDDLMTPGALAGGIKNTVNATLLSQVKAITGATRAVPSNQLIGEYTYILVKKDVLDFTKYAPSDITSLVSENCQDILSIVATNDEFADLVPLYSSTGELDVIDVKYFGIDENGLLCDDFSVLGGIYDSKAEYGAENSYAKLTGLNNTSAAARTGVPSFVNQVKILKNYEFQGYYGTEEDAGKKFAVGYVKGGPEVIDEYGDEYEVIPVGKPTLNNTRLFKDMFAINAQSGNINASVKVLNYLYTDETIHNILLYGVEGENYEWEETEEFDENGNPYKAVVPTEDNSYVMDANKLGNPVLSYFTVGEDRNARDYIVKQNNDAVLDLVIPFTLVGSNVDLEPLKVLRTKSAEVYEALYNAKNSEELEAALTLIKTVVSSDEGKAALNASLGMGSSAEVSSLYYYYQNWLIAEELFIPELAE